MADVELSAARYGKDKVRVLRVVRGPEHHDVVEYNVCALVEGKIETRCAEDRLSAFERGLSVTIHFAASRRRTTLALLLLIQVCELAQFVGELF